MRALISVSDKTGLIPFVRSLIDLGFEIVSSGGTFAAISEAGLEVCAVSDVTGAPEMLDGRVKTLHPNIHGGILADQQNPQHMAELAARGIETFDLVVVNLYPFQANPGVEMIDIGGPTMVRAAAKNFLNIAVVIDPADYDSFLSNYKTQPGLTLDERRELARKAFAHTASYDTAILEWFDTNQQPRTRLEHSDTAIQPTPQPVSQPESQPESQPADQLPVSALGDTSLNTAELANEITIELVKTQDLRYGENPHQQGALYSFKDRSGWWDQATVHQGKAMSYLNVYDTEAAWQLVNSFEASRPSAVVIKHANPSGAASCLAHEPIVEAYRRAHAGDPISAFGGIVALNRELDAATANELSRVFTEVVIAPGVSEEALEILSARKNMRVVEAPVFAPSHLEKLNVRSVSGGLLVQTQDEIINGSSAWKVVTERQPTAVEMQDLRFAWTVCKATSSNCIVLAKDSTAVGIGAGQQNRRDAGRIAALKADGRAVGGACASDAFFPFKDGLEAAIAAGATAVIQPGGSVRDAEVIDAANEANLAMLFTAERHFRH